MKTISLGIAGVILLSLAVPFAGAQEAAHHAGAVSYISGGVGADARQALEAQAKDFNLKLVFALASGEYVSAVPVTIRDSGGKTLVEATSDGPIFLAKLPAGSYEVTAVFRDKPLKQQVAVSGGKQGVFYLRWAAQP